jgi:MFS transporter, SP family, general alpha glucoside:H+ symporter
MCWGAGILLSSGVVRAVVVIPGNLAWRLPFALQWVWPIPLLIGTYLAPESPWSAVRRGNIELARKSLTRLQPNVEDKQHRVESTLAYIRYVTELEGLESEGARFIDCFKGNNLRRTEINCMVWAIQFLCGNALLNFSVVFLESAGFSSVQAFDINIALSACYIVGGIICWFMFPHFGRATIYMGGNLGMFVLLIAIGGLAFSSSQSAKLAIAVLFVITTLVNMITTGPG